MGAFPVIRLGLSDSAALRATILRVLDNAGITAPEQDFQGVSFWRISDETPRKHPPGFMFQYWKTTWRSCSFHQWLNRSFCPPFSGWKCLSTAMPTRGWRKLNSTHDYTHYGSGILDLHRLADQFLSPDTVTARRMAAAGAFDPATLSPECVIEIHAIIDNAPRMTMGVTGTDHVGSCIQYRVETPAPWPAN